MENFALWASSRDSWPQQYISLASLYKEIKIDGTPSIVTLYQGYLLPTLQCKNTVCVLSKWFSKALTFYRWNPDSSELSRGGRLSLQQMFVFNLAYFSSRPTQKKHRIDPFIIENIYLLLSFYYSTWKIDYLPLDKLNKWRTSEIIPEEFHPHMCSGGDCPWELCVWWTLWRMKLSTVQPR